ncbi:MAG: cell division protein DedD [Actinobacteria bacterium]|nr:MAG: cell division protein DedD [Actinomycetota bacterium]
MDNRPDWDTYYLGIAAAVAKRGECSRRQVGAVIVKDHTIIATGYNGAPPGQPSCLEGACPRARSGAEPGKGYAESGCTAVHAETNAIIRAGRDRCLGATLYCTEQPCELCTSLVAAAGIAHVVVRRA